jgi:quercetin dioxygenase-like cupin family protein
MNRLDLQIDGFLDSVLHHLLAGAADAAVDEVVNLRAAWPGRTTSLSAVEARRLPASDHLASALDRAVEGETAEIAHAIAELADSLLWTYSYPRNPQDLDLSSKVAFAQIAGSRGLRTDADIHIGLTLIAPHVVYPAHRHPAVELYLVVAGTALWQSGEGEPALRVPGSVILHPSNVVRAMTTFDEPLLAVWTWRGDLVSPSVYVNLQAETKIV